WRRFSIATRSWLPKAICRPMEARPKAITLLTSSNDRILNLNGVFDDSVFIDNSALTIHALIELLLLVASSSIGIFVRFKHAWR
ncbi:MAG: hypothetical protein AAGA30_13950, partial [Planctomycetota bacterium]